MRQEAALASAAQPAAQSAAGTTFALWPFRVLWRVILIPLGQLGRRRRVRAYVVTAFNLRSGLAWVRWEEP